MSVDTSGRRRYAIVGAGARAELYARAPAAEHADGADLGAPPVPPYAADDFTAMLVKERVDAVLVSTVDATHDGYIVAALDAGCDVITEKPMTTDEEGCRRVLAAARRGPGSVTVTFNYR